MSTSARTRANQENAQKSTGPRTPAGKAVVAQNARRHGLTGAFIVLDHEDQAQFDNLLAEYRSLYNPANVDEDFLVEQMAQSRWTRDRARRLEKHILDQLAGKPVVAGNPDGAIAAELIARSGSADLTIHRYVTASERSYYRARRELTQGRSRAMQTDVRNKANEAEDWLQKELAEVRQTQPFNLEQSVPDLRNALRDDDWQPQRPFFNAHPSDCLKP